MTLRLIDENKLKKLLQYRKEYEALKSAGVDNWGGYEDAFGYSSSWDKENCEMNVDSELQSYLIAGEDKEIIINSNSEQGENDEG